MSDRGAVTLLKRRGFARTRNVAENSASRFHYHFFECIMHAVGRGNAHDAEHLQRNIPAWSSEQISKHAPDLPEGTKAPDCREDFAWKSYIV